MYGGNFIKKVPSSLIVRLPPFISKQLGSIIGSIFPPSLVTNELKKDETVSCFPTSFFANSLMLLANSSILIVNALFITHQ